MDQIKDSPASPRQCVFRLLNTIGIKCIDGVFDDMPSLSENDKSIIPDAVALYRILCMAGIGKEHRMFFELIVNREVLDHIEKQYELEHNI